MKIEYDRSFEKDLRDVRDGAIRAHVKQVIESIWTASDLCEVANVKKLQGGDDFHRIRVGDYRIGAVLSGDTLILMRFLHRKDIYRYFP